MNILLQGAMDEEIDVFCAFYNPQEKREINGYEFFIAKHKGCNIIISKTQKGIINATIATTLASNEFEVDIVINQGCAGAHREDLRIGDIVIGQKSVYINDFKSQRKQKGEGSNSLEWQANLKRCYEVYSTPKLVDIAKNTQTENRVIVGILGSGDLHSKEYDRIKHLNSIFGQDCEDMESVASFKACETFGVERLAIRIISNNDLLRQEFDKGQCAILQKFIINLVEQIIL